MPYQFRLAASAEDFRQIHRLNHSVFSDELGQHPAHPDGCLIDPFEARSRYFLALEGDALAGMVCLHDQPPWSVARRLAGPAILDALAPPVAEIRLLALAPRHRHRPLLPGLLAALFAHILECGYSTLLISGVTAQLKMYRRLGFVALGPAVAEGRALFHPMALDLRALSKPSLRLWRRTQRRTS